MTGPSLRHVSVRYGATRALADASVAFPEIGLVLVLGSNGAGKSTLLDVLAGAVAPQAGEVLDGVGDRLFPPMLRRRVARLHQRTVHPHRSTVEELLAFAQQYRRRMDLWQRPERLTLEASLRNILASAGVADQMRAPFTRLSGGQQRLSMIVATILTARPILLLDEPLAGLSQDTAALLMKLLVERARERLILVVDHESRSLLPCVDRVVALAAGQVVLDAAADGLQLDDVEAVYAH